MINLTIIFIVIMRGVFPPSTKFPRSQFPIFLSRVPCVGFLASYRRLAISSTAYLIIACCAVFLPPPSQTYPDGIVFQPVDSKLAPRMIFCSGHRKGAETKGAYTKIGIIFHSFETVFSCFLRSFPRFCFSS